MQGSGFKCTNRGSSAHTLWVLGQVLLPYLKAARSFRGLIHLVTGDDERRLVTLPELVLTTISLTWRKQGLWPLVFGFRSVIT